MSSDIVDDGAALAVRQTEELGKLRGLLEAQKTDLASMASELERLGLPVRTPPSMEQLDAALPSELAARIREAAVDADRVLEDITVRPAPKAARMMRDTV